MLLAVEQRDLDVDDGEAVRAALGHRLLDALLHRGDVALARSPPPTILSTNAKPSPCSSGSTRSTHTANWP